MVSCLAFDEIECVLISISFTTSFIITIHIEGSSIGATTFYFSVPHKATLGINHVTEITKLRNDELNGQ